MGRILPPVSPPSGWVPLVICKTFPHGDNLCIRPWFCQASPSGVFQSTKDGSAGICAFVLIQMVHALGGFAPRLKGGNSEYEQKSFGEGQVASLRRLPAGPRVTISGAFARRRPVGPYSERRSGRETACNQLYYIVLCA
jgi:hypothetical protein